MWLSIFPVVAVVDVVVDLPSLTVLAEEAAKHALTTDPEDLGRHARLGSPAALPGARVATLAARRKILANAGPRVDLHGLANDEAILEELPNVEAGVRHRNLTHLVRIKPDALPAALLDSRSEPLLHREPCLTSHTQGCGYCGAGAALVPSQRTGDGAGGLLRFHFTAPP